MAYILVPFVNILVRQKIPITIAILLVYLSLAGAFAILILYVFPKIFGELNRFAETVPQYTVTVQEWIKKLQLNYSQFKLPESVRQIIDEAIIALEQKLIENVRNIAFVMLGLFSHTLSIIIAPILTFYLLKDHEVINQKIISFLPPVYRRELLSLWAMVNMVLRKFIRGHLSVALIVGVLTGIGLAILGMDFAFTLGFIAGVADIIPYFGPFIGAIPAVALALIESHTVALKVILVMFVVQQLESSIISPKIIGDSVGLHPLAIIFVLFLGGDLFGILGMLLAVPITAVAKIVFNYLYEKIVTYRTYNLTKD